MLTEVKELVQNHPAHQWQKLDSDKAMILPTAIACLSGVKGVPVGDTNLPHSVPLSKSPSLPKLPFFNM